ncbi:MAG: leucine-rich repeat protein, partial [Kiritimatiellae bacterium]|nr:leucine-rich repeat protein [Kiritimatiellia bacterium]
TVTRSGYTFKGWTPAVAATVPVGGATYKAQWTANKYTVTFNAAGGTGGWTKSLDYGSAITAPTVTRAGYTFKGWTPAVAATVPLNGATYTAQWTANKYTVTFDANGGTGGWTKSLDYGTAIVAPAVTRPGYTFKGWTPAVAATVPTEDVTYVAQWSANAFTITFDANGGRGGWTRTLNGDAALMPPSVTRDGYDFAGWMPAVPAKVPLADATYTAQWELKTYTIAFDANGGSGGGTSSELHAGDEIDRPDVGSNGSMVFAGWEPVPPAFAPASDTTYVAQWVAAAANTWDVRSVAGGVAIKGCSFPYGKVEIPAAVNGKKVVAVMDYAFFGQKGVTEVVIPDSVTTVGVKAFKGCANLTKVTMPARLATLGQAAFQDCVSLTEVDVPPLGDNYLWSSTFEGCTSLRRVSLPEGITAIGTSSFANCKALVEVNIPKSVKNVKSFAFFSCERLADVELPAGLVKIEQKAFKNCTSMTEIEIPSGVTSLGKAVFFNSGLVEATVPGGIAKVDDYCFQKCAALRKVTLSEGVKETGASVWAND